MVITARRPQESKATFNQIAASTYKFDISQQAPYDKNMTFGLERSPYVYEKGLLLCGGNDKGSALEIILHKIGTHRPKLVWFIDDNRQNVEAVGSACSRLRIPFKGFHYTFLNKAEVALPKQQNEAARDSTLLFVAQQCLIS
jgi:hypothetical protein